MNIDLTVPLAFDRDHVLGYAILKSFIEHQWGLFEIPQNIYLGAPDKNFMGDFPIFDSNLMYMFILPISLFCKNFASTMHIYFFITFFLVSYTSYYVFKKFKIPTNIAIFGSLLFAFAPFHIYRNIMHINYSSYYLVPLMLLVVFWMWNKKPVFFKNINNNWQIDFLNQKALFVIVIAILSGLSNIYYDYFWMFFLTVAAVSASIYRKNVYNLYSYILIVILNFCTVVLNAMPYIIHRIQNGANVHVACRSFIDVEFYALKPITMILPVDNHFLWKHYTLHYNEYSFFYNENAAATLGMIALIGFLFALFYFLFDRSKRMNIVNKSGLLIVSALLLATCGSFSTFIAYTIFSQIRCYNRISIFVSFLAILVFLILLKTELRKVKNKYAAFLLLVLIALFGIRDEVPVGLSLKTKFIQNQTQYYETKLLVKKIENINEQGAMIFQLPYVPFPENSEERGELIDYELLNPYLATEKNKLHWSYGVMKGRMPSILNLSIAKLPPQIMVEKLKKEGFSGILINKRGYKPEERKELLSGFNKCLSNSGIENDEYIYYSLK